MNLPHWPQIKGSIGLGADIVLGLDRVLALLERLGSPHKKLPPTIHIAGTNGKGSTLAYLQAMLSDAGYRVHKYTSPHLVKFNERIVINGVPISDSYLKKIINECEEAANIEPKIDVTFFEGTTVAAFLAFSRTPADVILLETGLGGRLDATNVIENPLLTILTSISLDHTEILGETLAKIAFEKAGIIKANSPVIVASRNEEVIEVIRDRAEKFENSPIFNLGKYFDYKINEEDVDFFMGNKSLKLPLPSLVGNHQVENAALAIMALYVQNRFKINTKNIRNGLKNVVWHGRIEKISKGKLFKLLPKNCQLYVDGSHNPDSAKVLASWISQDNMRKINQNKVKPKTYLICSMLQNKDADGYFKYLAGVADFVVGVPLEKELRGQKASIIARHALDSGIKAAYSDDFAQAFKYIEAIHSGGTVSKNIIKKILEKKVEAEPYRIIICGSLHLAGEFFNEN